MNWISSTETFINNLEMSEIIAIKLYWFCLLHCNADESEMPYIAMNFAISWFSNSYFMKTTCVNFFQKVPARNFSFVEDISTGNHWFFSNIRNMRNRHVKTTGLFSSTKVPISFQLYKKISESYFDFVPCVVILIGWRCQKVVIVLTYPDTKTRLSP